MRRSFVVLLVLSACSPAAPDVHEPKPQPPPLPQPEERHFGELRQLTFGGENAEAYWSFAGDRLIFQASPPGASCDQIYTLGLADGEPRRVSNGQGVTTCSYFLPGDEEVIYASTHLSGAGCPPKPDRSHGYVWALYQGYEIFRAKADGSAPAQLTRSPGYDAEATVCAKDGSVVFTSVRDGDLELYRMKPDGSEVVRLTHTPGYDGGAFFSADCSKIVWRASRPVGEALADYQKLLAQGLVRPTKLELMVANADGSEARQVTYLDAASFAPFFFPDGRRIVFSSNYGDARGREFELWAIDVDGTRLERVTHSDGFDGFPIFSPDGQWLAFGSNRGNAPGSHDTNVFMARWQDAEPKLIETAADRVRADVAWLAHPDRKGRGIGLPELEQAAAFVEKRFVELGLAPVGTLGHRQPFEVTVGVEVAAESAVELDGAALDAADFRPLSFSAEGDVRAPVVLAGYGVVATDAGVDDFKGLELRGKIALVRRFVPDAPALAEPRAQRQHGDLRRKAWLARERGAVGLIVVDAPIVAAGALPEEAALPPLELESAGDAGIPVVALKRTAAAKLLAALERSKRAAPQARLRVALRRQRSTTANVLALLPATERRHEGAIVLGAHYDHLGLGGHPGSLAPDSHEPHLGADDNASGVAALLETARLLAARRGELGRDVLFVAFSGEESGVLGSSHFVRQPPAGLGADRTIAMLNFDMVGRLRDNTVSALGGESATEWPELAGAACRLARIDCRVGGEGYGPSDQTPFYAAGVPVLHFFTGAHGDYHKPSDAVEHINAAGIERIAAAVAELTVALSARGERLHYQQTASPPPRGDVRMRGSSLGTVPDYAGPPPGQKGVLLAGVRPGGAADKGGLLRGDLLVQLGPYVIGDVRDLMFALGELAPGKLVKATVLREGKRLELEVTLEAPRPRH